MATTTGQKHGLDVDAKKCEANGEPETKKPAKESKSETEPQSPIVRLTASLGSDIMSQIRWSMEKLPFQSAPVFQTELIVFGRPFIAHGNSKKDAKSKLAEAVLAAFPPSSDKDGLSKKARRSMRMRAYGPDASMMAMSPAMNAGGWGPPAPLFYGPPGRFRPPAPPFGAYGHPYGPWPPMHPMMRPRMPPIEPTMSSTDLQNKPTPAYLLSELAKKRGDDWRPKYEMTAETKEDPDDRSTTVHTCTLTIHDEKFTASSRSKKICKHDVAKQALKKLFDYDVSVFEEDFLSEYAGKNANVILQEMSCKEGYAISSDMKRTEGALPGGYPSFQVTFKVGDQTIVGPSTKSKKGAKSSCAKEALYQVFNIPKEQLDKVVLAKEVESVRKPPIETKHPVSLLMEMCSTSIPSEKPVFEITECESTTRGTPMFTAKLTIGENVFQCVGAGRKLAKLRAAHKALTELFGVYVPKPPGSDADGSGFMMQANHPMMPRVPAIADYIADLVRTKYNEICTENGVAPGRDIAGFVITTGERMEDAFVASIASGSTCISAGKVTKDGCCLMDCHAMVLARRGLLLFLYNQLQLYRADATTTDSIFEYRERDDGFKLKCKVKIHFFISSIPCGDARIRDTSDLPDDYMILKRAKEILPTYGLLRVKSAEYGTVPVVSDSVNLEQTWKDIQIGEPLSIMSCSDKLLRWNAVGIQGALLGQFVDPIYIDTIILGGVFHPQMVERAFFRRIEGCIDFSVPGYWLNEPFISGITDPGPVSMIKTEDSACNWIVTYGQQMEIASTTVGRNVTGLPSRLCKKKLMEEYLSLYGSVPGLITQPDQKPSSYDEAKKLADPYQKAKLSFTMGLERAKLGKWVKRPTEIDSFEHPA